MRNMASRAVAPRLVARFLRVRLTPLQAAERLSSAGAPRVALLCSAEPSSRAHRSYVAAFPDASHDGLDPMQQPAAGGGLAAAPHWIGVVPYESRRSLERSSWCPPDHRVAPPISSPMWLRYPAVACFEGGPPLVVGTSLPAVSQLRTALESDGGTDAASEPVRTRITSADPEAAHVERVRRAIALILAGDLYQVCIAHRLDFALDGGPLGLFRRLLQRAPAEFSAYLDLSDELRVLSTSPELLLHAQAKLSATTSEAGVPPFASLWSEPIKGTRPRGSHTVEDRALAAALEADPKERAELDMIVDVVRNDLGAVAELGSVRLASAPQVVTHRTVHHRRALLKATALSQLARADVLAALLPSGSVTGAPKVRAMEVIAELEQARRGLYTGGLGFVSHAGDVRLAMAIRTAVMTRIGTGQWSGHYWTGGGIVVDSDPEREWRETGWKASQLLADVVHCR